MRGGRADRGAGRHASRRAPYPTPGARLRLSLGTARTRARFAVFVGVFVFANLAGMSSAFGDGEGNSGGSSVWRWMDVEDSHGNSAWGYSMSLDYGGMTDVGNAVFGGVTGLCWFFYQWFVIASIWLINFALGLDWFDPLREPAADIAAGLEDILARAELVPLLLVITAVTAGLLIMRGAWATAIFEVVVALVVLSLGTGVFDDPVDQTIGATGSTQKVVDSADGSGWLAQANGAGLELAGGLQGAGTGGAGRFSDPEVVREDISAQLVDTFLRTPHQLINYGKVLDDTKCEGAYNRSLSLGAPPPQPNYVKGDPLDEGVSIDSSAVPSEGDAGWEEWKAYRDWITLGRESQLKRLHDSIASDDVAEYGWTEEGNVGGKNPLKMEPREIVKECDKAAGDRAENPSPGMAGDAATMGFGVMFLVGLAALLAFTLIFLGVEFLWCALRSIWDFVIGLLPGRSRHTLWQTLSTAVWCLVGVAFTSIFLVTYLLILNAVARSFGGGNIMGAFALVDILMLVGLILFWRLRKRMKSAAARTAALLAKRPNPKGKAGGAGAPVQMPANGGAAGLAAGAASGGRRALKVGKATAAGTVVASGVGATGIGRAARVGGALGSGGALLGVGVPFAVGRKMNPWRRDRAAFGAAQGQFEKADAAAQAASATNGDAKTATAAPDRRRPHGSREAFADARGLRSPNGRPQSSRRVALGEELQNAQDRTLAEQMTAPDNGEPRFKRVVSKSGVVTFEPVEGVRRQVNRTGAGTAGTTRRRDQARAVGSWVRRKSFDHGARALAWGSAVGVGYTSPSPNVLATVATVSFAADVTSRELKDKWGKKL